MKPFMIAAAIAAFSIAAAAFADTYYHDAAGRVVAITYDNGVTVCYAYDNLGNRTRVYSPCSPPSQ